MKCRCRVPLYPGQGLAFTCEDTDVGDGGMCHYCSHVCHGSMTSAEYWAKFPGEDADVVI